MSERKPRLAALLVAAAVALTCGYALKASAGPDVAVDAAVSQPMSGPQLSNVQGFMASPEASSFIKEHPGAEGLAGLQATPDNLQALGALAEELKAGKSVPAAYDAAASKAVAELDSRAARAAQAVAEGRADAASLDAAAKSFAAYRVYGKAAAAKVNSFAAAARQARAKGRAQAVAQQLLGSLRQDAGELASGEAGASAAGGVDAASAKTGAQVHRAAALGKAHGAASAAAGRSAVDGSAEAGALLVSAQAAHKPSALARAVARLRYVAAHGLAYVGVAVPTAALAYNDGFGAASSHAASGVENFGLMWALFVLGGMAAVRLLAGLIAGGLKTRAGRMMAYSVGGVLGAVALSMGGVDMTLATDGQSSFMLWTTLTALAGAVVSFAVWLGGVLSLTGGAPSESDSSQTPAGAARASSAARPSVGSTPGARPTSARPAQQKASSGSAVKLPSARTLNGKNLSTWLNGSDSARVTAAADEILRRGVVNEFAVAIAGVLGERPADILLPDLRLKLINALGDRRPNAAGNNVVSQSLLRVVENGSPDEVLAATKTLLKIGDEASLNKLGALVEEEFVERYQNGNGVRADVARGVLARMEELRQSQADPKGPAYRRLNQVLSRRADNEVAARAAALSREVYARNPRYVPSSYSRSYYDSDDDFWTAYWVSGVMGFPYPSNYGMMFYFMHQMNAAQSGTMPSLWEVQRDTYNDYSNGNLGSGGYFGGSAPADNYGFPAPAPSSGADQSSFGGNADLAPPPADSLDNAAAASGTPVSGADRSDFGDFSSATAGDSSAAPSESSSRSSGAADSGLSSGADRSDFGGQDNTREPSRDDSAGAALGGAAVGAASSSRSSDVGSSREDSSR